MKKDLHIRMRGIVALSALALLAAALVGAAPTVEPVSPFDQLGPPESESDGNTQTETRRNDALKATSRTLTPETAAASPSLYLRTRMEGYRRFMDSLGGKRQRVKIRDVSRATGNNAPVFYPALHWVPDVLLEQELLNPKARYSPEQFAAMARDAGRDNFQAFILMGMLNVRLYFGEEEVCCNPTAVLLVELAVDELDPRILRFDMTEVSERGVYYVDDPHGAASDIMSEVISFGERPVMTIVALEGSGFETSHPFSGIPYAVRWGTLDLEYGSHIAGDPKGVIR